jgi:mono/diheme cytochrome c family protein
MNPAMKSQTPAPRRNRGQLRLAALLIALGAAVTTALAAPPPKAKPAPSSPSSPSAPSTPSSPAAPPPAPAPSAEAVAAGKHAFLDVARVLQSPRCQNCHPAGDAPLQTDLGKPHAMNISRKSAEAGLPCTACHQERNSEAIGIAAGPPGAPHWNLPPRETPMVFEGKTPTALCEQLRDPAQNGKKTLAALLLHVSEDALVLWGWNPGGKRTLPPLSHPAFVAAFKTWVDSNGACP